MTISKTYPAKTLPQTGSCRKLKLPNSHTVTPTSQLSQRQGNTQSGVLLTPHFFVRALPLSFVTRLSIFGHCPLAFSSLLGSLSHSHF